MKSHNKLYKNLFFVFFMKISEIFYSIQGEGPKTGEKAIFVRLAGCNLKCRFCDSKYAHKGATLKLGTIINKIKTYKCKNVIWTGGEPTLQIKKIIKIINKLKNYFHNIETNATNYLPTKSFDTIVLSPKKQRLNEQLIKRYRNFKNVYFKFVIENKKNYEFWKKLTEKLKIPKCKAYFMPEAKDKETLLKKSKWLAKIVKKDGFNFSTRIQILHNFR
jgi:7-carboxy-7-deazaguanine synthase